jgi:hypothetical protein
MKTCSNCGDAFIETHHAHKYCSEGCRDSVWKEMRKAWDQNNAARQVKTKDEWKKNNRAKLYAYKAKAYRAGKLPPWMFS